MTAGQKDVKCVKTLVIIQWWRCEVSNGKELDVDYDIEKKWKITANQNCVTFKKDTSNGLIVTCEVSNGRLQTIILGMVTVEIPLYWLFVSPILF